MSFWRQTPSDRPRRGGRAAPCGRRADAANGKPRGRAGAKAAQGHGPRAARRQTRRAAKPSPHRNGQPPARRRAIPLALAVATSAPTSSADLAAVKEAFTAARRGRTAQAGRSAEARSAIRSPASWSNGRSCAATTTSVEFARYVAFIAENPNWPASACCGAAPRRRSGRTASIRRSCARYFGKDRPLTTKGKFALARALLLQGDRAGAQRLVREAWRNDNFSAELEGQALDVFGDLITTADHKARMDMRLYAEDADGGLRRPTAPGGNAAAIAKARIAVIKKAANAKALLDAVPAEAHRDVGYLFSRSPVPAPRRQGGRSRRADAVGAALITARRSTATSGGSSGGWSRASCSTSATPRPPIASRAMPRSPARTITAPSTSSPPAGSRCASSTIPATALTHFAKIGQGNSNPITLARAGYWQGRAAEALGRKDEARAHYEAAARYSTAYYGQIARARLGLKDIVVRPPPARHDTTARSKWRAQSSFSTPSTSAT